MRAQGTASSGPQWWTSTTCPSTALICSALGVRVEASQTVPSCAAQAQQHSAAPQRAERCGAGLRRLTCRTLSLHPPSPLIKALAAASLPGPAKSNHIAGVQLEMLSGTEVRG